MEHSILLVEDERSLAHIIRESLEKREFRVTICENGEQALKEYSRKRPDILVLDVMMPVIDGFTLAARIREEDKTTPIIFLTARSQSTDVVQGFEAGANDYLKKPFSMEELIVRVKALLSRNGLVSAAPAPVKTSFTIGTLTFNSSKNFLSKEELIIPLTSRESEILKLLCNHNQEILTRDVLLNKFWGNNSVFSARSLDVFITKLRKHLSVDPGIQLINIRGIGYKLVF